MKRYLMILFFSAICAFTIGQNISSDKKIIPKYYDKEYYLIEGTTFTDSIKENTFDRFPISYKNKVRNPVWNLSKSSAGISVRFLSNSSAINVKWELLNDAKMNHIVADTFYIPAFSPAYCLSAGKYFPFLWVLQY